MRQYYTLYAIRYTLFLGILCLCMLLCCPADLLAQTAWAAQRQKTIDGTVQKYLDRHILANELQARLAYLHAEAYYLYTQGFYKDALAVWQEVLSLDADNETALHYIEEATSKINARDKTNKRIAEEMRGIRSVRQKKLGPTQSQYSHTKLSHNELNPEYKMRENRFFDHSISLMRNEQEYAIRTNRYTTTITENIRADTSSGDYDSSFIASWNYDHSGRDDFRPLRYIQFLLDHHNYRFIMGDSSTYLSRYVLNGINYRGLDFMAHTDESTYPIDRFKIFYGLPKAFDEQSEDYFYPIEIFGVRNELEVTPGYKFGLNFGYQVHENKITRIDSLFRPKRNIVYSFDQFIKPADWWVIRHEIAYSEMDNEVRNDIVQDQEVMDREDWAHYITSNILREKWQMYNVYEYGGPNFKSLAGEPKFFKVMMPVDRELLENVFVYTPTDELLFELQYHRLRDNVEDDAEKETTKENWFKGLVRITPKNTWMPMIGLKGSLMRIRTLPGSSDTTDKKYTRDFGIEFLKTLYGVDWTAAYTFEKSYEDLNYKFCDIYRSLYSIRAQTSIVPDTINLNFFYSYANVDILAPVDDITSSAYENKFDTYISSRLWGSSNISLGYHYFNRRDHIGTFEDLDSHTASVVFNWPYTRELFNNHKFTMSPYLAYYYTKDDEYTDYRRTMLSGRLAASYFFNPENKLNMSLEYINGVDGSDQNQEGDEIRFITTYRSTFGLP